MTRINRIIYFLIFVVFISFGAAAHDTTHVHPMITKRVSDLIESNDSSDSAYLELYTKLVDKDPDRGLFWGKDRDLERTFLNNQNNLDELLENNFELYGKQTLSHEEIANGVSHYDNVMDGVVQEDAPVQKVLNHFYHAISGSELTLNGIGVGDPSAVRAMGFFNEAISWYSGYTDESKKRSYFIFGQALHHVEDMSSPAHIHNDPHLTFGPIDKERDDYEGWFLPSEKRFDANDGIGNKLDEYFGNVTNYSMQPVTNPWLDIWGIDNTSSMVRYFYDKTVYSGTLEFPYTTFVKIDFSALLPTTYY